MEVASGRLPHHLDLVVDFVNTRDVRGDADELSSGRALAVWLAQRDLLDPSVRIAGRELGGAIELRESLREILRVHDGHDSPPVDALTVLDATARRGQLSVCFSATGAPVALQPRRDGVAGALSRLLAPVALATLDGTWSRVKACAADDCQWAFYDRSRNRSGRWCDMADCGNLTKVRSYRQRARGGAA